MFNAAICIYALTFAILKLGFVSNLLCIYVSIRLVNLSKHISTEPHQKESSKNQDKLCLKYCIPIQYEEICEDEKKGMVYIFFNLFEMMIKRHWTNLQQPNHVAFLKHLK